MRKTKLLVALLATILLSFSLVAAIPVPPHQFYGTITIGGEPAADELTVDARIENITLGSSITQNGRYGDNPSLMMVDAQEGSSNGKLIEFYIDDNMAYQTYIFKDTSTLILTELNLTFESFCGDMVCNEDENYQTCPVDCEGPSCGDGSCNGDETCTSCSQDCGACTTSTSNQQSSGGSSGRSSGYTGQCTPSWDCTGWTECSEAGIQTRTCTNIETCGGAGPELTRTCTPPVIAEPETEEPTEGVGEEITGSAAAGEEITGWVIGGREVTPRTVVIVLVLIVAVGLMALFGHRRVKKRKKIEQAKKK